MERILKRGVEVSLRSFPVGFEEEAMEAMQHERDPAARAVLILDWAMFVALTKGFGHPEVDVMMREAWEMAKLANDPKITHDLQRTTLFISHKALIQDLTHAIERREASGRKLLIRGFLLGSSSDREHNALLAAEFFEMMVNLTLFAMVDEKDRPELREIQSTLSEENFLRGEKICNSGAPPAMVKRLRKAMARAQRVLALAQSW
jgi:hypothetical protein